MTPSFNPAPPPGADWTSLRLSLPSAAILQALASGRQAAEPFRHGVQSGWPELERIAMQLAHAPGEPEVESITAEPVATRGTHPFAGLQILGLRHGLGPGAESLIFTLDGGQLLSVNLIDPSPEEDAADLVIRRAAGGGFQVYFPRQGARRLALTPDGTTHDISRSTLTSVSDWEQRLQLMNEGRYLGLSPNPGPPPSLDEIRRRHGRIQGEMDAHAQATRAFEQALPGLVSSLGSELARMRGLRDLLRQKKDEPPKDPPKPAPATPDPATARNPKLEAGPPPRPEHGAKFQTQAAAPAAAAPHLPHVEPWPFQIQSASLAAGFAASLKAPEWLARWIRAALLDPAAYREAALLPQLDSQAWLIFAVATLAAPLLGALMSFSLAALLPLAGLAIKAGLVWMLRAAAVQLAIRHWLKGPAEFGAVFRATAFAQVPLVLGIVPLIGPLVLLWSVATLAAAARVLAGADTPKTAVLTIIAVSAAEIAARLLQSLLAGVF